ncbi:uncharacterized protein PFL1_04412 [Pseudozyma flocculosa PF-1]|uniref:Related to PER1 protein, involved in manganese homeostasis n=2 Tax=Pseudozyma flocculosa TaxID=84751 RepID=A0A5C3FEH9_9BASI|nr:uncharacterized protein PFL1_04412 [Pseudozyma flocculosa PF-1]EPQ28085.1 hypothetical protein PFL1_04412 [Pseudozyma flocculosa PF-1]SPO41881.1 related to PER1 protein, involved in manganese homeostasis [Pseudozyma flocculosa]
MTAPRRGPAFDRHTPRHRPASQHRRRTRRGHRTSASLPWHHLTLLLLVGILCLVPRPALASQGDRSPEYKDCVASCTADLCRDHIDDGVLTAHRLPWILRVTKWTCEDDCKYHCTHMVTNDAAARVQKIRLDAQHAADVMVQAGTLSASSSSAKAQEMVEERLAQLRPVQKQMVQYHGKWVFVRFLGAQEPLSVIFSLLNLRVQLKALLMFRKQLPDAFPLKLVYIIHTLISINAWLWSAVFHTRDKHFTEKMDYFSAGAVILSGFFFSVCRLFRLSPGTAGFRVLQRSCVAALALHILYLSVGRFDYAYNMTANVCVGLAHNALWLIYSLRPSTFPSNVIADRSAASRAALRASKPPSALATPNGGSTPPVPVVTSIGPPSSSLRARRRLQLLLGLMTAAALLEVLDFPPILRFLDAHSLWHLATVPISEMWYRWLADDARECVSTGWWLGDALQAPDVAKHAATALGQAREWASDRLKGRAAVLAQNMELNALTAKLNDLANRAGFSGSGVGGGLGGGTRADTASSTGIELGTAPTGMTEREREKARELGERARV